MLDETARQFATIIGRKRHRANVEKQIRDGKKSSGDGVELHVRGAHGEVAVALGFGIDVDQIRWDRPGRDETGIDLVAPSGVTIQVKTPTSPRYNLIVPGTDPKKIGHADVAILVDLYKFSRAEIFGWIRRADFIAWAREMPRMEKPCVGMFRDRPVPIGESAPDWVNE